MARITFAERMALQVATAVAEEVKNNLMNEREFLSPQCPEWFLRPVLIEYGSKSMNSKVRTARFFFEGGMEVFVHLLDEGYRNGDNWVEDWSVAYVSVRYYEYRDGKKEDKKTKEDWDICELQLLKQKRPWYHPHVVGAEYFFSLYKPRTIPI